MIDNKKKGIKNAFFYLVLRQITIQLNEHNNNY